MFQYAFSCNEEEEVTRIRTLVRVDDGKVHIVNIRYVFNYSYESGCECSALCCGQFMFTLFIEKEMQLKCEGETMLYQR